MLVHHDLQDKLSLGLGSHATHRQNYVIKELIDSRELGQLYYYDSVRVNLGLFQHDVNVMWDLAVHDLSIMDYLLGMQPRTVTATAIAHIHGRPEDIAYITCAFDGGLIAHFP